MKNHPCYDKARAGGYLNHADLASLVRSALKRTFPETNFSVRSHSYSGGSSVDVRWEDGPTSKQVDAVIDGFVTKGFDGMIDLAHGCSLWLYPDGSAHCAHDAGTMGSMGTAPEVIESPRGPDAVLVENVSHSYVSGQRDVSPDLVKRSIDAIRAQNWRFLESFDWDSIKLAVTKWGALWEIPFFCDEAGLAMGCNDNLRDMVMRAAYATDARPGAVAPTFEQLAAR